AKTAFDSSDKLDRLLFERYGDVQAFARSPQARSLRPAAIRRWIDFVSRSYEPNYALTLVAGTRGRIVAAGSLDPHLTPRDASSPDARVISMSGYPRRRGSGTTAGPW